MVSRIWWSQPEERASSASSEAGAGRASIPVPAVMTEAAPTALALGDVNGDGRIDLAAAHQNSRNVRVFLGQTGGGLDQGTSYDSGDGASAVALADLDGDGRLDLLVAHADESNFTVHRNQGAGRGQPLWRGDALPDRRAAERPRDR